MGDALHEAMNRLLFVYNRHLFSYIDDFISMKCFPDIASMGLYPNAKEITETCSAFWAVMRHVDWADSTKSDVTLVSVGDGSTPRTAAMFAYRTAWDCISIDPLLKNDEKWNDIRRLNLVRTKCRENPIVTDKSLVIVAVHSHAPLTEILSNVTSTKNRALVAIPCCVPYVGMPDLEYTDSRIWSPKNKVMVWRNI